MARFFAKRTLTAIIQVLIVTTIVFFALKMMPGDPVLLMLSRDGSSVDPAAYEALAKQLGLDKPILRQYRNWLTGLFTGDLGMSYTERRPVMDAIGDRLPRTLELAGASLLIAVVIGIPLGIAAAVKRGSWVDLLLTGISSLGQSVPVYVFGYILVLIFALNMRLLPSSGYVPIHRNPVEHFRRLILPACTIAFGFSASMLRMTRSSMLEALSSEFVRPLYARGLSKARVHMKHMVRNMLIPVVTIIGLQLGALIAGTVLCEAVFNWPGIATLLVKAISNRDYPLIQGCMLILSIIFIVTNMVVDLLYGLLDPRAR
ncbi:MAG: ABC transporter permease [Bacillota bacterium]|jgi:peptide/nickel transport system permease protein|nr:ABC transporter permease [Bacillota bacterium]NLM54310.1 ABC transporter permease [Bacillota bacterium]